MLRTTQFSSNASCHLALLFIKHSRNTQGFDYRRRLRHCWTKTPSQPYGLRLCIDQGYLPGYDPGPSASQANMLPLHHRYPKLLGTGRRSRRVSDTHNRKAAPGGSAPPPVSLTGSRSTIELRCSNDSPEMHIRAEALRGGGSKDWRVHFIKCLCPGMIRIFRLGKAACGHQHLRDKFFILKLKNNLHPTNGQGLPSRGRGSGRHSRSITFTFYN